MQRFMGYPLTLKKIDFDVSLDINGRLRQKSKDVMYMIITLPEAKSLLILSCPLFCFRKRIFVQNFFSIIIYGMVTLCLLELGWS